MAATPAPEDSAGTVRQGFDTKLPVTTLGKWSMWLAVTFLALWVVNMAFVGTSSAEFAASQTWRQTLLPFFGIGMMLVGFVAGVLGLVAVLKQRERSIITLLTIIPAVLVTVFLLGEFLIPH